VHNLRRLLIVLLGLGVSASLNAETAALDLKSVSSQRVLSVRVASPREFPVAFDKLAQYCGHESGLRPTAELSVGSTRTMYAAVAYIGDPRETDEVKVLDLPAATVATRIHRGPYEDLPTSIKKLVDEVRHAGYAPDESALLRLLYKNSPRDNPPEDLITEIQLPVMKR
jgi:effector-binding domain-containing protein